MNRKICLSAILLAAVLLLSGCVAGTVEDMYHVPRRSENYNDLQSAIDTAMDGLEYSAPRSGDHQQTVQMADLDGDGCEEYLLFAAGGSEKPLKILIFQQIDGDYRLVDTIESQGTAFAQAEYVDIDGYPGVELVIGRQVSDQVLRSVSVYTFHDRKAVQLMMSGYTRFLTCDLDENGSCELMIITPGEAETDNAVAALYSYRDGAMDRSREAELSGNAEGIRRIMTGSLSNGMSAVFVASAVEERAIVTDIFTLKSGVFTNISYSNESGTSVNTLQNYYVYAEDIDSDGILELPSLVTMRAEAWDDGTEKQYLIRWFAMDPEGREEDKLYSFHNFADGWYLELDSTLAHRLLVKDEGGSCRFWLWDEDFENLELIFSIYTITGPDRELLAVENNRFVLYRAEGVIYAGRLEAASAACDITQDDLLNSFHLIHQDWKTGET